VGGSERVCLEALKKPPNADATRSGNTDELRRGRDVTASITNAPYL
jgi:hypothetical protein